MYVLIKPLTLWKLQWILVLIPKTTLLRMACYKIIPITAGAMSTQWPVSVTCNVTHVKASFFADCCESQLECHNDETQSCFIYVCSDGIANGHILSTCRPIQSSPITSKMIRTWRDFHVSPDGSYTIHWGRKQTVLGLELGLVIEEDSESCVII